MKKIVSFLILASLLTMCMGLVLACNGETCSHAGGTATCQEKAVCDACGKEYGNLGSHSYENYICKYCGAADPSVPTNITITFNTNGGSPIASKTQSFGTAFDEPKKPTLANKYFLGWFLDNTSFKQAFSFKTKPTKDITLFAKWVDITPIADFTYEEVDGEITLTSFGDTKAKTVYVPQYINGLPVTDIGKIFQGNDVITEVYLPEGVTSIAGGVFSITDRNDPDKMRYSLSQESAFSGCTALVSIYLPDSLTEIGDAAFYATKLKSIKIPASVDSIGVAAFMNCGYLASISIPEGVEEIADFAFYQCRKLTSIDMQNGVTSIGFYSFAGCSDLKNIVLADSIETFDDYAFWGCESIVSLELSQSLKSIGKYAFEYCGKIKEFVIPNEVHTIATAAFSYCSSLTKITFPASLTSLASRAFDFCTKLTIITIDDNNEIYFSDAGVVYERTAPNADTSSLMLYPTAKTAKEYELPSGVVSILSDSIFAAEHLQHLILSSDLLRIEEYAINNCHALQKITIKEGLESIGDNAFAACTALKDIVLPDSLTSIGEYAFWTCISLENIVIPSKVTVINDCVFYGCSVLKNVTFLGNITTIGMGAFYNCTLLESLVLPSSLTTIGYAIDSETSVETSYAFDGCPNLTLYIEASSAKAGWRTTWNKENHPVVWGCTLSADKSYVESFVMPVEGIENIGTKLSNPYREGQTFDGWLGSDEIKYTALTVKDAPSGTTLTSQWKVTPGGGIF